MLRERDRGFEESPSLTNLAGGINSDEVQLFLNIKSPTLRLVLGEGVRDTIFLIFQMNNITPSAADGETPRIGILPYADHIGAGGIVTSLMGADVLAQHPTKAPYIEVPSICQISFVPVPPHRSHTTYLSSMGGESVSRQVNDRYNPHSTQGHRQINRV